MVKSRNKSFSKLKAFIFCLSLAFLAVICLNLGLALNKPALVKSLNKNLRKTVSIENVFYLPPSFIFVKGFALSDAGKKDKILESDLLVISLSLKDLLSKKFFVPNSFYSPQISLKDGLDLGPDLRPVFAFLNRLPSKNFKLRVDNLGFKGVNFSLQAKNRELTLSGKIKDTVLNLKGSAQEGQFNIEGLTINNQYLNCQLWGKLRKDSLELNGFALKGMNDPATKSFKPEIFFLDIDSRIKFWLPSVEIEKLSFTVNKNPVFLRAELLLKNPFSCNLKLISNFRGIDPKNSLALKKINFSASLAGDLRTALKIDTDLALESLEPNKESSFLENLNFKVKDLVIDYSNRKNIEFYTNEINFLSKTTAHTYAVSLKDFSGRLYGSGEIKKVKFNSKFQDGLLSGRANVSFRKLTPLISSEIRIKDISSEKLESIIEQFEKVSGKLSARMFFFNFPELLIKGKFQVTGGSLNNFEFFKWLSNLFELQTLKDIRFDILQARFLVDKEGAGLDYMNLDSKRIKLSGYFKLRQQDMVSSKVFFSIRREFLQRSAKFIPLLKLIGKTQDWIKFNFQLSGKLQNLNFRWLESEFKEDLKKAIPGFAKKGIENKISKIIESIVPK